jgi:hypothetical protein
MKETLSEFLARIGSRVHAIHGNESLAFIHDKHRPAAYRLSDCVVSGSYSAQQIGFTPVTVAE